MAKLIPFVSRGQIHRLSDGATCTRFTSSHFDVCQMHITKMQLQQFHESD